MVFNNANPALCESMSVLRVQIFDIGHALLDRNYRGKCVSPTHGRLYFILDGEITITGLEDGKSLTVKAGQSVLLPAGYSFAFSAPDRMEQIYFYVKLCCQDEIDLLRNCPQPLTAPLLPRAKTCAETVSKGESLLDCLAVESIVTESLIELLQEGNITLQAKKYSPQVHSAIAYITKHLSLQLSLEEIAEHALLAPSTLTRKFKQETGMSVSRYIDELILSQAASLILEHKDSIQQISESLGFCDQFYFARKFKSRFGMSPSDYRKMTII